MKTLIFNNTTVQSGTNNSVYIYSFPAGGIELKKGDKIAIQSVLMPYSWFNINSSLYNNSTFVILVGSNQYTITLPTSFMQLSDINYFLQQQFISLGLYLVNSANSNVYFGQLVYNTALYAVEFDSFPIPVSLPSGHTNPANVLFNTLIISTPTTPQLRILSNGFGSLIGFGAGTFPPVSQTTNYSVTSTTTPNMSPVNSVIVSCNLCVNKYSIAPQTLFSFSPNTSFGSNIIVTPSQFAWIDTLQGSYPNISLRFTDQNYNQMYINDPTLCIQLVIKSADE